MVFGPGRMTSPYHPQTNGTVVWCAPTTFNGSGARRLLYHPVSNGLPERVVE